MNIEKAIKNFELRGYSVRHFATGAEAADYLAGQVQDTTVGIGRCKRPTPPPCTLPAPTP